MRKTVGIKPALAAGALLASAAIGPALATPPQRPVAIEPIAEKQIETLKAEDGAFTVPLRVTATGRESAVVLTTTVMSGDEQKALESDSVRLKTTDGGGGAQIRMPVMRKPGVYKIEIAAGDASGAVYDRAVFFEEVSENGTIRLYTQKQWRAERQSRRSEAFSRDKTVKSLAGSMRTLTDDDLKRGNFSTESKGALLVRPDADLGGDAQYVRDVSKDAWRARDPVTFRGRIVYTDFDGTVRPLVNAGVYLYDDDWNGDDFLGSVATDGSGRFSFSVNNDDGWLQNGRDLFVKLKLRNTRWRVYDGGDYEWSSDQFDDVSDGRVIDIGTVTPDDDMEAVQIFEFIDRAWQHGVSVAGSDPGHVDINYPSDGDYFNGEIHYSDSTNRAPDIAVHEYGHFMMEAAYPGGDPSPGGAHGFDGDQDPRLSWSEGWASGFMLSLCNDGQYNWDEGTSEGAGEWPSCTVQNDAGGREIQRYSGAERLGEKQEGRVAAIILDLVDTSNDDNGGNEDRGRNGVSDDNAANTVSLATIYRDVMVGGGHNDLLEFWTSLSGELSGAAWTGANHVFRYNWASVSAPIDLSCVASKVAAAEFKDYAQKIDGLRAFRDTALKPYVEGRELMQIYYRNSPELAQMIIKSPKMRERAAQVVSHFAKLGAMARDRKSAEASSRSDDPVVPKDIAASVNALFTMAMREGSPSLRVDATIARKQFSRLSGVTFAEAIAAAEEAQRADAAAKLAPVIQKDLSPASRKVDWNLIRRNLSPDAGYSLQKDDE